MALQKLAPAPVARYVTVQDAVERIGVSERTLRRWIEELNEKKKKFHRILRDPSGFVRLDLEEVEQIVRARGGVVPSVHQHIEHLLERIEALESEQAIQAQQYQELVNTVEHFQQARMTQMQPVTHRHSGSPGPSVERRGLPEGTLRLVDFAQKHTCTLSEVKKLHEHHEIEVAVYQREAPAVRNKQEWWITPAASRTGRLLRAAPPSLHSLSTLLSINAEGAGRGRAGIKKNTGAISLFTPKDIFFSCHHPLQTFLASALARWACLSGRWGNFPRAIRPTAPTDAATSPSVCRFSVASLPPASKTLRFGSREKPARLRVRCRVCLLFSLVSLCCFLYSSMGTTFRFNA